MEEQDLLLQLMSYRFRAGGGKKSLISGVTGATRTPSGHVNSTNHVNPAEASAGGTSGPNNKKIWKQLDRELYSTLQKHKVLQRIFV